MNEEVTDSMALNSMFQPFELSDCIYNLNKVQQKEQPLSAICFSSFIIDLYILFHYHHSKL